MKRPGGLTVIAIYYLVTGALALLSFCALIGLPTFGYFSDAFRDAGLFALASLGVCFGLFFLLDGALSVAAGWGILKMQEWGRLLGIFLAIFTLFAFPVGTVVGALILWYLFQGEAKAAFGIQADTLYSPRADNEELPPVEEKEFVYYPPEPVTHEEPPVSPEPSPMEEPPASPEPPPSTEAPGASEADPGNPWPGA